MSQAPAPLLLEIRHCAGIPRTAARFSRRAGRKVAPRGGAALSARGGRPPDHSRPPWGTQRSPYHSTPSRRGGTPGPEVATLVQGRFKRDGSAAADPEL